MYLHYCSFQLFMSTGFLLICTFAIFFEYYIQGYMFANTSPQVPCTLTSTIAYRVSLSATICIQIGIGMSFQRGICDI